MLTGSLSVDPSDDAVGFSFTVENDGDDPVTLSFRSGQRADFAVREQGDGDEELWRWSEGRMFTQVLGSETLDPGETRTFEGSWDDPSPGDYTAAAELATEEPEVTAEAEFSV